MPKEALFMLTDIRLPGGLARFGLAVFLVFCVAGQESDAMEGFYVGGAVGGEYADVDFRKSVGRVFPDTPVAFASAGDDARGWTGSFKAVLGHRWNLPGRMYFSGEADVALRLNNDVTGYLEGITDSPDGNVFPGDWYLDKNHSVGFNAKLGYSPEGISFWGGGGSVYAIVGIQRLDVTARSAHEGILPNGEALEGEYGGNFCVTPWLAGVGMEIGGERSRLDLRAVHIRYDVDFTVEEFTPPDLRFDLPYEYNVREWGIYLGYTWSLGFGLGT